jgi:hypothetical protein
MLCLKSSEVVWSCVWSFEGSRCLTFRVKQNILLGLLRPEAEGRSVATDPVTQGHIPGDLNYKQHRWENLKYPVLVTSYEWILLGAFAKLRKATISFAISVRPSARNSSPLTGRIFMKFDIVRLFFFEKSVERIQNVLKSDKNNGSFTWRPRYIDDHISLSSS